MYILYDSAPLQKILSTLLLSRITDRSFGTTSLIELSDDPMIVQEWILSHSATWCLFHKRFLIFNGHGYLLAEKPRQKPPEAILRMPVEEHRLSRFDRRKRPEDQYSAVLIKERRYRMDDSFGLHHILPTTESKRAETEDLSSLWRRHPESNRGIRVLQTRALPLGYVAVY